MRLSIIVLVVVIAVACALPVEVAEDTNKGGNSNPENIESPKEAALVDRQTSTANTKSHKDESHSTSAVHRESHTDADGGYEFSFETENGQKRDENGHVDHTSGNEKENIVVKGHFSYVAPDGIEFFVKYIADEKGFRPIVTVKRPAA